MALPSLVGSRRRTEDRSCGSHTDANDVEERGKGMGSCGGGKGTDNGNTVSVKKGEGSAKHGSICGGEGVVVECMEVHHHKDEGEGKWSNGEGRETLMDHGPPPLLLVFP